MFKLIDKEMVDYFISELERVLEKHSTHNDLSPALEQRLVQIEEQVDSVRGRMALKQAMLGDS